VNSPLSPNAERERLIARLKQTGPATWLLSALVLLLLIYPLVDDRLLPKLLVGVLNMVILIAGAFASSRKRRTLMIAFGLALPASLLHWMSIVAPSRAIDLMLCTTMAMFYVFTIAYVLGSVLQPGPVTGAKLHGAIAAYIMLGFLWTFIYVGIDHLTSGAFTFTGGCDAGRPLEWREFVFFSFVTLTTTGYGDIVPAVAHAQSAAVLEQLAGTFYVAVLIARLAGLYQPGASRRR
jgi:hypothetical protein